MHLLIALNWNDIHTNWLASCYIWLLSKYRDEYVKVKLNIRLHSLIVISLLLIAHLTSMLSLTNQAISFWLGFFLYLAYLRYYLNILFILMPLNFYILPHLYIFLKSSINHIYLKYYNSFVVDHIHYRLVVDSPAVSSCKPL